MSTTSSPPVAVTGSSTKYPNRKDKKLPPLGQGSTTSSGDAAELSDVSANTSSSTKKKTKSKSISGSNGSTKSTKNGTVLNEVINHKKNIAAKPVEEISLDTGTESGSLMSKTFSVLEAAKMRLSLPPWEESPDSCGKVRVRFNHYNKHFPIHNGVLKWQDIDDEYCISFVYKGDFKRHLILVAGNDAQKVEDEETGKKMAVHDHDFLYYVDLHNNDEYALEVVEDPEHGVGAEGLRISDKPLNATELKKMNDVAEGNGDDDVQQPNRAVQDITQQLKEINPSELGGEKAKELLEQRDLEDVLFSG